MWNCRQFWPIVFCCLFHQQKKKRRVSYTYPSTHTPSMYTTLVSIAGIKFFVNCKPHVKFNARCNILRLAMIHLCLFQLWNAPCHCPITLFLKRIFLCCEIHPICQLLYQTFLPLFERKTVISRLIFWTINFN